jgi:hypothetical protein
MTKPKGKRGSHGPCLPRSFSNSVSLICIPSRKGASLNHFPDANPGMIRNAPGRFSRTWGWLSCPPFSRARTTESDRVLPSSSDLAIESFSRCHEAGKSECSSSGLARGHAPSWGCAGSKRASTVRCGAEPVDRANCWHQSGWGPGCASRACDQARVDASPGTSGSASSHTGSTSAIASISAPVSSLSSSPKKTFCLTRAFCNSDITTLRG